MITYLNEILRIDSVSGNEENMINYVVNNLNRYCDEYFIDNLGNLIVHLKGEGEKIMVNTPISENGLFVTFIEESGQIKFSLIGTMDAKSLVNRKVKLQNSDVYGIIVSSKNEENLKISDLSIDLGCFSKEEAEKKVKISDVFAPVGEILTLNENIYASALSKKVGIYVLMETIKALYGKTKKDLYFAFTIEDNLGFKGAKVATQKIKPDSAFIISCADITSQDSKVSLAKGVAIRIKDSYVITNKPFRDQVIQSIAKANLPYQLEIVSKEGIVNNEIMYMENGILTANLNFPIGNMNSYYECVNLKDVKNLIESLLHVLEY